MGWISSVATAPDTPPMKKCNNDYLSPFFYLCGEVIVLVVVAGVGWDIIYKDKIGLELELKNIKIVVGPRKQTKIKQRAKPIDI